MAGPFLHLIQYDVGPEDENAFDEWYNIHILNVLQCPGYKWSSRYVSQGEAVQGPDIRCLTLYTVEDRAAFDVVLTPDRAMHPPPLQKDTERFEKLQGVSYIRSGVYEQVAGSHLGKPLLRSNRPLLLLMTDVAPGKEEAWNQWVVTEELPSLLQDPWVAIVGHFRAVDGVLPPWLVQGPRHLTLCELEGGQAARAMYHPEQMSPALRRLINSPGHENAAAMTERQLKYFYEPISQHWSFKKARW